MVLSSSTRSEQAKLAVLVRHRPGDTEAITSARRDFAASKLSDYISRTLATAPPLTDSQRERLAHLLRGGGANV